MRLISAKFNGYNSCGNPPTELCKAVRSPHLTRSFEFCTGLSAAFSTESVKSADGLSDAPGSLARKLQERRWLTPRGCSAPHTFRCFLRIGRRLSRHGLPLVLPLVRGSRAGVDEDAFDAGIDCTRCNDRVGRERVRQDGGEHCCKSTPSGRGAPVGPNRSKLSDG